MAVRACSSTAVTTRDAEGFNLSAMVPNWIYRYMYIEKTPTDVHTFSRPFYDLF